MIIHIVKAGDTAANIAARHGVELANLLADNGLEAGASLGAGQSLAVQPP